MKMHLYIYLIYQLYALLRANAEEIPTSPCPEVFRYESVDRSRDSIYLGVRGVITIPPGPSISLKVIFELPVVLNKYHSKLEPRDKNSKIMEILRLRYPPKIVYYLDFQKNLPVPTVIKILLNDQLLCSSTPISGSRGKTTVYRFHSIETRHPFYNNPVKEINKGQQGYEAEPGEIHDNSELPRIPITPGLEEPKETPDNSEIPRIPLTPGLVKEKLPWEIPGFENCGLDYTPKRLIIGGTMMKRGEGPWMVPLYARDGSQLSFVCTSSLISKEYIITAAHCVWKDKKLESNNYIAYVGQYNLNKWPDDEAQIRGINRIHVHPNYRGWVDYDLAVLKLNKEVEINRYVNFICIWNQEEDIRFVEGREAMVFGWGKGGSKDYTETPHSIRVPIVSQDTCKKSNPRLAGHLSSRTLCAGSRNGRGPCNGDSGGGLLLPITDDKPERRWLLRGVTSSALTSTSGSCDLANYVIYTDLAKYKDWVLGFIVG